MTRKVLLVLVLSLVGSLVYTSGQEVIKLGMNLPMTGIYASAGIDASRGAQIAVEEINRLGGVLGRKVEVVIEDNRGEVESAIAAAEGLIHIHRVPVVIGPNYSFLIVATHKLYWDAGIVNVMYGTRPELTKRGNPYLFRTRPSDALTAPALVRFAVEHLQARRIAIVYQLDDFGVGGKDALLKALLDIYAIKPVAVVGAHPDLRDYTGVWMEVAKSSPDVVFQWLHGGLHAGLSLRSRYEMGLAWIPIVGTTAINEPGAFEVAGADAVEGAYVASEFSLDEVKVRLFNSWYREKYGTDILGVNSIAAYDSVYLVCKAIEKAGTLDPASIREALVGLEMEGVMTKYYVRHDGETVFTVKMGFIYGGRYCLIKVVEVPVEYEF